jgi:putative peptidoglycan lipid II flippase
MSSALRNVVTVMSGTLVSRVLGFVRQVLLNNLYVAPIRDAFNAAYTIPNLFREVLAEGAVTNALIPVLVSLPAEEAPRFARRFGALLLGINLLVLGLGYLWSPEIVGLLLGPKSHIDPQLTLRLTRLMLPFLAAISMSALFSALLQAEERFFVPSFAPLLFNVGVISLMVLWRGNPTVLGLSVSLGGLMQAGIQLPFLRGYRLEPLWHPAMGRALRLMVPFLLTTTIRQLTVVVMTRILSSYPPSALTGYKNGDVIFQMCLGLFSVSPALAFYPRLSELAGRKAWGEFRGSLERALARVAALLGLVAALVTALAPWLVGALFAWSRLFGPDDFRFSAEALRALGLALLPWGLNTILLRAFYARMQVLRAIEVTLLVFALNSLLYVALEHRGMFMLNLATLGAGLVGFAFYTLRLSLDGVLGARTAVSLLARAALAALIAGSLAFILASLVGPAGGVRASLPPLLLGGGAGLAGYLLMARLLGLPSLA